MYPQSFNQHGTVGSSLPEHIIRSTKLTAAIRRYLEIQQSTLEARLQPLLLSVAHGKVPIGQFELELADLLQEHAPPLKDFLDGCYAALTELEPLMTPEQKVTGTAYHRALTHPFWCQSPALRRMIDKPLGYPGDYRTVELIFDKKPDGPTPMARLLSQYCYLSGPACAHRGRALWVHQHLRQQLARTRGRPLRLLSFACGPERVLRDFCDNQTVQALDIVLADSDRNALRYCQKKFDELRADLGVVPSIRYIEVSAFSLLKNSSSLEMLRHPGGEGYDCLLVLGLLDYLPTDVAARFLDVCANLLAPGGSCLLTNLHRQNPWQSFMEYTLDWNVLHRDAAELTRIACGRRMLEPVTLVPDATGTNLYFTTRRTPVAASR
jgi:SAM-dependent methyltransferase